jgi:hypothetical protein
LAAEAADGKTRQREEPRFFEPMSMKEWRDKGHCLADVGPVDRDPDDDEFLAAVSVANALQRALTWEATDDGMSVLCGSNYMQIGYVFTYCFCYALVNVYLDLCSLATYLFLPWLCISMLLVFWLL